MDLADLVVDVQAPEDALHAAMTAAAIRLLPAWSGVDPEDVHINVISGGISNALYKLTHCPGRGSSSKTADAPSPQACLVRVFGQNTERFIDRAKELQIMRLVHEHGFGPQVGCTALWMQGQ